MRLTPVKELNDECLIDEFSALSKWAGDDFSVNEITPKFIRRAEAARKEILRRMSRPTVK